MLEFNCQNPICQIYLSDSLVDRHQNLALYCITCNKYFCLHCANKKNTNGREVKTCIYCNNELIEKKETASLPDNNNIALAVSKRLAMGEQGQKMQKGYCLKCFREVVVSNLSELPNTTCTNCGESYFMDVEGNKYQGEKNTYQLTEENQSESFLSFIKEFKTNKLKIETDILWGKVELNNWLYRNIIAIDMFKVAEVYREQFPDDAAIFQEAINQFKK